MSDFAIKARKRGTKVFSFITPTGGLDHLRVHASLFTSEKAAEFVAGLRTDNPTYEFKVVDLRRKVGPA